MGAFIMRCMALGCIGIGWGAGVCWAKAPAKARLEATNRVFMVLFIIFLLRLESLLAFPRRSVGQSGYEAVTTR
jgi:hypothetical protein